MSEQTSPTRFARRSVIIALSILCIILVFVIVGVLTVYTSTIRSKEDEISSLTLQISSQNSTILNLTSQVTQLNGTVTSLGIQVSNLTAILAFNRSSVWYNGTLPIVPFLELTMLDENAPYAGYVAVHVYSPEGNATVVQLIYYSEQLGGYRHDDSINVGSNGTAIFPVLPSSMSIYFYDPALPLSSRTANVTIVYYY